jgi:hypothetical protein
MPKFAPEPHFTHEFLRGILITLSGIKGAETTIPFVQAQGRNSQTSATASSRPSHVDERQIHQGISML